MSLKKRIRSFRYAFQGLFDLFKSQPNAQVHLIVGVAVIALGFYCRLTGMEWAVVVLCIAFVISLEALNTGLEYLTDIVSPEYHPLAGKAKDVAAAAVLVAASGAVVAGLIIFIPRIFGQ